MDKLESFSAVAPATSGTSGTSGIPAAPKRTVEAKNPSARASGQSLRPTFSEGWLCPGGGLGFGD